jgi:replication factor C small subunit
MDAPLWTETHAPSLSELPQPEVRERLFRTVDEPMNLVIRGPPGAGKTAAVRALAAEAHDDVDADLTEINVADFFDRTKKRIREDPRFSRFLQGQTAFSKQYRRGEGRNKYKREWSKRDMISHILQEMASYQPASGSYKTVLLDNAETIREDFQQALRRVMEQYHRSTQFVIATRQPSKLIPAIRSRCFPIPVRAPSTEETETVLAGIADAEGIDAEPLALNLIASKAGGDLRHAVLAAQHAAVTGDGEVTASTAETALSDVGHDDALKSVLDDAAAGEIRDARTTLTSLLDDEGFGGQELLGALLGVADTYPEEFGARNIVRLHRLAGGVDLNLAEGNDPRLHITHLLAAWAGGQSELDREAAV